MLLINVHVYTQNKHTHVNCGAVLLFLFLYKNKHYKCIALHVIGVYVVNSHDFSSNHHCPQECVPIL